MIELGKNYNADEVETNIYNKWLNSSYFTPENLPHRTDLTAEETRPYTIVLPPPNVTGNLHMGHAFENTVQDILVRFRRMQGRKTLWIPGTDHAPIATESKVTKLLEKQGNRKSDLSRDEFVKKVEEFAANSHDTIIRQLKQIGSSLDWSREAYTFDEKRSVAVRTAFKNMYEDGLIYQGYKVINWDPKGQTVISDDEVLHQEREAVMYTFKYSADFPIPIATTRPETKLADTAVAVHPNDKRYHQYINHEFDIENFAGVKLHIKVIADESIDPEFGTGALGVTPAHSMTDYEMSLKHELPMIQAINEFGKMIIGTAEIVGTKMTVAREIIVKWLEEKKLIIDQQKIKQNISIAERSGGIIEPLPKIQWFIAVNKPFIFKHNSLEGIQKGQEVTLKQLMRHVITTNLIEIIPPHFEKIYFNWIDSLRDWCISRQLLFGHRIPIWYKKPAGTKPEIYCGITPPVGDGWEQDPDTLDTWFSSGLWTFAVMGWPEQTTDLETYHPTSVIIPGYEILFFWVARMILMTTYNLGVIPFEKIYLHGIVRDKQGRKFSKSLDNGVDPLKVSTKYGTDALRMSLVYGAAAGNDLAFDEQQVKGMKHFANKLWNISRFILANIDPINISNIDLPDLQTSSTPADMNVITELNKTVANVTTALEKFRLHDAAQSLYQFVWYEFADKYIETSKTQLANPELSKITQQILFHCLKIILTLLHPFMPFITEHIWSILNEQKLLPNPTNLLLIEKWPSK